MLFAMKNNRQTKITEDEKQKFINLGYKIAKLNDDKLEFEEIETEESKEIEKLKEEIEALKVELEDLKVPKQGMTKEEFENEPGKTTKTKGEGK